MALRHRHHGSGGEKDETAVVSDDYEPEDNRERSSRDDDEPIGTSHGASSGRVSTSRTGGDDVAAEASEAASSGTLTMYMGSISQIMRNIELEDVYRYWSKLRDWLADVPNLAVQQLSSNLPPSIAGIYFGIKGPPLTPEQEQALEEFVAANVGIPYTHEQHWHLLEKLWDLSFPGSETKPEQHDQQWKRLGFQGMDPATDFRSAGVLSVHALIHFAESYPDQYQDVMMRTHGKSPEDSYPFACAAINITFMLMDVLKLKRPGDVPSEDVEAQAARATLARLLAHNKLAFLDICVVCLIALDNNWVKSNGTYMRFPFILKDTRESAKAAFRNSSVSSADAFARLLKVDLYGNDRTE